MNKTIPQCRITQPFAGNITDTYVRGGMKGHSGVDSDCGFGSAIKALWGNEYVYKVLDKNNPANDGSGFTGVFTIVDNGIETFEFLYGHCNPTVLVGQILAIGEVLGTQANNGEVYAGTTRITLEMQKAGDMRGTHRHDQMRVLRKDTFIQPNTKYISGMNGLPFFYNGSYFAVPFYDNGFNGCVNWVKDNEPILTKRQELAKKVLLTIEDYQLECGLIKKRETNYKNIPIGPKTLLALSKDKK